MLEVDKYLDYIINRTLPDIQPDILEALEGLWSASSVPGTTTAARRFDCAACNLSFSNETTYLKNHVFMIVVQGFADAYTMDLKALMKCCHRGVDSRRPDHPLLRVQHRGLPRESPRSSDCWEDEMRLDICASGE